MTVRSLSVWFALAHLKHCLGLLSLLGLAHDGRGYALQRAA